MIMTWLAGHLQARRNRPTCAISWSQCFIWRGFHCCRGEIVGRTKFWHFFEWLAIVRVTG
jgi:hypothetical protein